MVKVRKDLTGQRFDRLTVMYQTEDRVSPIGNHYARYHCVCDCGNEIDIDASNLIKGSAKSCGCLSKELIRQSRIKSNEYDLTTYDYGIGYTKHGEPFYFDLEDYDLIKNYLWRINTGGYLEAKKHDGSGKRIMMHNLIMNHIHVDHIGGGNTKNDNRKSNLRIPPDNYGFQSYNQMNKRLQRNNTSGCPGVWQCKNKWRASIKINKQRIYLGAYENFDDAVKVRKEAEQKYFGEYSYDNSQLAYQELQKLSKGENRDGIWKEECN